MNFLISDTFTESLGRLAFDEQKAVKTTAFDLQMNPASPGMQLHRLDKTKDKNFWSVRVSRDIRIIIHKTQSSLLVCYAGHHDDAYAWAERRKLETHPKTGAAQLVEIRETAREVVVPIYRPEFVPAKPKAILFADKSDDELLAYGVPAEWLDEVRRVDEDGLLSLAGHIPAEAAEALLELATGGTPRKPKPALVGSDPFTHPDAQRRFRVMTNIDELQAALDYPWDKWTIFLHPEQKEWVDNEYSGPARVSGSAGTGKTIVALHRTVHLARKHPDERILLATFSDILANALKAHLNRLLASEPRLAERIDVCSLPALARRLYKVHFGILKLADNLQIKTAIKKATAGIPDLKFTLQFLFSEWEQVVDAWQVSSWEEYRDVNRLGRKTRLPESRRKVLWDIFSRVHEDISEQGLVTLSGAFTKIAHHIRKTSSRPYGYSIVDESQDLSVAQMRFFAAVASNKPDGLFFAGDLGQRIFQSPFSWKSLGVDIRGRSRNLRVNYRTSHQIRSCADRLLGPEVADLDGNSESRKDTISVFNGPAPLVEVCQSIDSEQKYVSSWINKRIEEGLLPHEIGIFVRSEAQVERAEAAVKLSGLKFKVLDSKMDTATGWVTIGTMHLAKGLEFKSVVVMACDDEVVPLQDRIQNVGDDADLQEVYDTERHLLYVACTRARDELLITAVSPPSEFIDDFIST